MLGILTARHVATDHDEDVKKFGHISDLEPGEFADVDICVIRLTQPWLKDGMCINMV
jgi:hypothetical protein